MSDLLVCVEIHVVKPAVDLHALTAPRPQSQRFVNDHSVTAGTPQEIFQR